MPELPQFIGRNATTKSSGSGRSRKNSPIPIRSDGRSHRKCSYPDTSLSCGDLNCRLNHHIIPTPGKDWECKIVKAGVRTFVITSPATATTNTRKTFFTCSFFPKVSITAVAACHHPYGVVASSEVFTIRYDSHPFVSIVTNWSIHWAISSLTLRYPSRISASLPAVRCGSLKPW